MSAVMDLAGVEAAVRALSGLGLAVFPVRRDCKAPAVRGWQDRATADPEGALVLLRGFWPCNVGVATGERSGVFVLDIDCKGADGRETLARLEREHGGIPGTWISETPSGGEHRWFAYPSGRRVSTRAAFAPGLDIRGAGGLAVVPPSQIAGRDYRWRVEPGAVPLAEAPDWLLDLCAPIPPPTAKGPSAAFCRVPRGRSAAYVATALIGEIRKVESAPVGVRNQTLFKAAASLGELVGAGVLNHQLAELALNVAADACGLSRDDGARSVAATIASGLRRGFAKPRTLRA